MNQNVKMVRVTPTAASTIITKVTLPAMAPALLPPALLSESSELPEYVVVEGGVVGNASTKVHTHT